MPDQLAPPVAAEIETENLDAAANEQKDPSTDPKEIEKYFHARLESAKRNRKTFYPEWKRNVELRMGRSVSRFTGGIDIEDETQSEINPDWALTKAKTANLFSQVPAVQGTHENKQYALAVPPFMKQLNYELGPKRANIGVAMEECLNDVVNASGIAAVYVGYAARFEDKMIPAVEELKQIPPEMLQMMTPVEVPAGTQFAPEQLQQMMALQQIPMVRTKQMVSDKIFGQRISPTDLLWPAEFTGSDFDDGDWNGYSGSMSWPDAKNEFDLDDHVKDQVLSGDDTSAEDDLRSEPDKSGLAEVRKVQFDRLFYWRSRVDPDEKNFSAIWEIVYLVGLPDPVKHEPWKGQKYDDQAKKYVGACKLPVRILTLTYITDNPIPPSDSSAGRPQVNDLRRSRSQMFQNRERSIPIRGFDVNRVDPTLVDSLMKGTFQGMIPFNGNAQNSIWEVARASYPAEDFSFDAAAKADLMEIWQIGPNQLGTQQSGGKKTSAEVQTVQQNFATRIGQERNRVAQFFLGICDIIAGYMVLYSDFPVLTPEEKQGMEKAWDQKHILHDLVLKLRPDSTIVLDAQARLQRLMAFLNMTAKSGFINAQPIIAEMAELSGLDPSEIIIKPESKIEEPNISYRFSGKDDLMNPVVMAMLVKKQQAPSPEELQAAIKILQAAASGVVPPLQPPVQGERPDSALTPPVGQEAVPGAPPPAPGAAPGPGMEAHPDWSLASKISKRSRDVNE